jgi:crossover junction endodeoxyribonuclease RuvC
MRTGTSTFRVLGIDPGLHITGYAAVEFVGRSGRILEAGTVRTDAHADMPRRIHQIHTDLTQIIREVSPNMVAIEQLYAHYKHPRTAILMGHARGAVLLCCEQAGVSIRNLAATKVKKSLTGNGHASKLQMQRSIQAICRLDKLPEPPDVADAIAIALCAGQNYLLEQA